MQEFMKSLELNMNKNCENCNKKFLCKDYGKICDKWQKEDYTELIKKDNGIKEIRGID